MRSPLQSAFRNPQSVFVIVAVLPILVLTLHPAGRSVAAGWTLGFGGREALAELVQNLLLFIPLGAALALAGRRPLAATLLGAALSLAIEIIQQAIPGRDPNVGDIVCNTIGTAIGAGLVWTAPRWLFVSPSRAAWQALALALVACGVWLVTGWLLAHPWAARELTLDDVRGGGRALSLGDGWRLIFSPGFPRGLMQLLNATWIGGWVLAIGYWTGRAGRHPVAIAGVVIAVAGLVVIPSLVGVRMMTMPEIVGLVGGLGVGWRLHRVLKDRGTTH